MIPLSWSLFYDSGVLLRQFIYIYIYTYTLYINGLIIMQRAQQSAAFSKIQHAKYVSLPRGDFGANFTVHIDKFHCKAVYYQWLCASTILMTQPKFSSINTANASTSSRCLRWSLTWRSNSHSWVRRMLSWTAKTSTCPNNLMRHQMSVRTSCSSARRWTGWGGRWQTARCTSTTRNR